ncbi:MAG: hypothetical protein ABJG42_24715 [Vibrio splendidus]
MKPRIKVMQLNGVDVFIASSIDMKPVEWVEEYNRRHSARNFKSAQRKKNAWASEISNMVKL